ncbi:MAG: hypothetical protein M0R74_06705 [Dehalococcoidia bacterium]|nr:hypothetical protein [Dehalococcoidia bacterium]
MTDPRERDEQATPTQEEAGDEPGRHRQKREEEMSEGKHYRLHATEAQFEYDPASHRASEEGGEPQ